MSSQEHEAVAFLLSFFEAMNRWEVDLATKIKAVEWGNTTDEYVKGIFDAGRKRLEDIFAEYCDAGIHAERLQDERPSFGAPPQYSVDNERIVSYRLAGDAVIVETQRTVRPLWEYRYELCVRDGDWRIRDKRKKRGKSPPGWEADLL
jgi:hypothetical protein